MAKAIKTYAGGVSFLAQAAVRDDGALFERLQSKGPYGYRWGAWKRIGSVNPKEPPAFISCGFSNLYPRKIACRLPN